MSSTRSEGKQKKRLHPQKFGLWVAIGSMIMMFGGFTSGYIVRRGQGNWTVFDLPTAFTISTVVVIISSITMLLALRTFKRRMIKQHRLYMLATTLLGIAFGVLQCLGFYEMYQHNITIDGNPSGSFIFVIAGAHLAHMLGGIIALMIQLAISYKRKPSSNPVGVELVSTYWHFVDILWLYLFIFFLTNR